jgi:hypothetical protein
MPVGVSYPERSVTMKVMSEAEVKVFGDKLSAFGKALSPKEQALLRQILLRATAAQPEDVGGYDAEGAESIMVHLTPLLIPAVQK